MNVGGNLENRQDERAIRPPFHEIPSYRLRTCATMLRRELCFRTNEVVWSSKRPRTAPTSWHNICHWSSLVNPKNLSPWLCWMLDQTWTFSKKLTQKLTVVDWRMICGESSVAFQVERRKEQEAMDPFSLHKIICYVE